MEESFGSYDSDVGEFTAFSGSKEARMLKEAAATLQLLYFTKGSYIKEWVLIKSLQGH